MFVFIDTAILRMFHNEVIWLRHVTVVPVFDVEIYRVSQEERT